MKPSELNDWLTLVANISVLAGIVFLALELQQTRTALVGEYHANRADRSIEIAMFSKDHNLEASFQKFAEGEELTPNEREAMGTWANLLLRHFEDIQYQRTFGLIDDEVWESNLRGMAALVKSPAFRLEHPEWPGDSGIIQSFRTSFVDLIGNIKDSSD